MARDTDHHVFQLARADQQFAGARGNRVRHHVLAEIGTVGVARKGGGGAVVRPFAGNSLAEIEPGVGIQHGQVDVERQAALRLGRRGVDADTAAHQLPRRFAGGSDGLLALVMGGDAAAKGDADIVVQRAAGIGREPAVEHEAQRRGTRRRLGDRGGQVQRQPRQVGINRNDQLVVAHRDRAGVPGRAREMAG